MAGLIANFREKFSFLLGRNAPVVQLPEDILQSLDHPHAYPIRDFVEWACNQTTQRDLLIDCLLAEARRKGWPEQELKKLKAYAAYFSLDFKRAHDIAMPFAKGEAFDADFFGIAALALYNSNQYDRAYRLLREVQQHEEELAPGLDYLISSALICWSAGDLYRTDRYLAMGCRMNAADTNLRFNALAMYFELGNKEAVDIVEHLVAEEEDDRTGMQYSRAFIYLATNDFEVGFRMAECRYNLPEAYRHMRKALLELPRWQGEPIPGKTLLIHGEQGLGDMIMTARYFPAAERAAGHVIVECPAESIALLEHNFPNLTFLSRDDRKPYDHAFDLWLGTVSLPFVFGTTAETVPGKSGYLRVPQDHQDYWRARVNEIAGQGRPKVGIAWSGYPGHRADRRRSLPWAMVRPLLEQHSEIDFFAVQTIVPDDLPENLHDFPGELVTLSDTAALIGEMDLIVSVDTSVVHIAGAIGKRTWMMLPYRYEWRWGIEGEDNCWYDSVRVLRQPAPGAWAPVLSKVFGRELGKFVAEFQETHHAIA